jgi:hypothetical protein
MFKNLNVLFYRRQQQKQKKNKNKNISGVVNTITEAD